jgi:hypothetical protein
LLDDPRHVPPPGRTAARPQRFPVQGGRDSPQRVAALAQITDFGEHGLLVRIGLDVLAVRAETEPEPDIANPLPTSALVPQRVPGAWSTTLGSYLRSRSEYM